MRDLWRSVASCLLVLGWQVDRVKRLWKESRDLCQGGVRKGLIRSWLGFVWEEMDWRVVDFLRFILDDDDGGQTGRGGRKMGSSFCLQTLGRRCTIGLETGSLLKRIAHLRM